MLAKQEDLRQEEKLIRQAFNYCEQLTKIEVSDEILSQIKAPLTAFDKIKNAASFRRWPAPLKWGMEALVVSGTVAGIVIALFWTNIQNVIPQRQQLVLAEQKIRVDDEPNTIVDKKEIAEFQKNLQEQKASDEPEISLPEVAQTKKKEPEPPPPPPEKEVKVAVPTPAPVKKEPPPPPAVKPTVVATAPVGESPDVTAALDRLEKSAKPAKSAKVAKSETPPVEEDIPEAAPVPKEVSAAAPVEPKPTTSVGVAKPTIIPSQANKKGYVYKLFMKLTNLDQISPEIADKIIELGGEKAGEVELGWRKPDGSYYHFILPKENYKALQDALKTYGPVTLVKDPHDRIMAEGKERYILWIEGK